MVSWVKTQQTYYAVKKPSYKLGKCVVNFGPDIHYLYIPYCIAQWSYTAIQIFQTLFFVNGEINNLAETLVFTIV